MAHRHDVHKRAMRGKRASGGATDPVESFEKKDKYGEDKAANGEGYKASASMAEAKGARSRDKDVEGAIHGNKIKKRPGRRMGGAVGADGKPLSSAAAGLNAGGTVTCRATGGGVGSDRKPLSSAGGLGMAGRGAMDAMCRATGGAVGEFAKGGKVDRDGYASGGFHPGGEKGKLHREMGIPEGEKIPAKRLSKAAHSSNPEIKRDAIRAETMKKWKH